jgi:hypothetical protein
MRLLPTYPSAGRAGPVHTMVRDAVRIPPSPWPMGASGGGAPCFHLQNLRRGLRLSRCHPAPSSHDQGKDPPYSQAALPRRRNPTRGPTQILVHPRERSLHAHQPRLPTRSGPAHLHDLPLAPLIKLPIAPRAPNSRGACCDPSLAGAVEITVGSEWAAQSRVHGEERPPAEDSDVVFGGVAHDEPVDAVGAQVV